MSQQAIISETNQVATAAVSENFRMHTIGIQVAGGVVRIDVRVPGGEYEPVMDADTDAPLEVTGTESIVLDEIAIKSLKFKPDGATYSAIITSQASD